MLTAHDNGSYIIKDFEVGFDIKALTQTFLITLSYRTESLSLFFTHISAKLMYFTDVGKALAKHN